MNQRSAQKAGGLNKPAQFAPGMIREGQRPKGYNEAAEEAPDGARHP